MGQVPRFASVVFCMLTVAPLSDGRAASDAFAVVPDAVAPGIFIPTFKSSDFPFVTIVPDDGKNGAGGWQAARANLKFTRVVIPTGATTWYCPITIQVPIRNTFMGSISPGTAATMSADVTNSVASTMDFDLPPGIFCNKFKAGVRAAFPSIYPKLGARVDL